MAAAGGSHKKKPKRARSTGNQKESAPEHTFTHAFAKLLRSRKIPVPRGLKAAPPEAYANEPASMVADLERLPDDQLERYAERIAGFAKRQRDRAKREWESSPLISELRRRKLEEPPPPSRAVGASVSLTKPLQEWSDPELLKAAREWSERGRS